MIGFIFIILFVFSVMLAIPYAVATLVIASGVLSFSFYTIFFIALVLELIVLSAKLILDEVGRRRKNKKLTISKAKVCDTRGS